MANNQGISRREKNKLFRQFNLLTNQKKKMYCMHLLLNDQGEPSLEFPLTKAAVLAITVPQQIYQIITKFNSKMLCVSCRPTQLNFYKVIKKKLCWSSHRKPCLAICDKNRKFQEFCDFAMCDLPTKRKTVWRFAM